MTKITLSLALVVSLTLNAMLWRQEVKCPKVQTFVTEIEGSYYYAAECSSIQGTRWILHCSRSGRY